MTCAYQRARDKRTIFFGLFLLLAATGLVMASNNPISAGGHGWKKGKHKKGQRIMRLFDRFDTNKDGLLSQAELATVRPRLKQKLAGADTNNDGLISKAELQTAFAKFRRSGKGRWGKGKGRRGFMKRGAKMFKRLDVDNSGTLTANEIAKAPPRAARFLSKADLNKDGVITKLEMRSAMRTMMKKRRAHRGKRGFTQPGTPPVAPPSAPVAPPSGDQM